MLMPLHDDAFKKGDYAIVNLMYTPVDRFMMGAELTIWQTDKFQG